MKVIFIIAGLILLAWGWDMLTTYVNYHIPLAVILLSIGLAAFKVGVTDADKHN